MASSLSSRPLSRLSLLSQFNHTQTMLLRCNASFYNHKLHSSRYQSRLSASARRFGQVPYFQPISSFITRIQHRGYAELKPSGGKSEADLIVEELQELYDNAKDELEIATDSTNSATIYAASDRESARELLDQLVYVYKVYTEMTRSSAAGTLEEVGALPQQDAETVSPNPKQANADRLDAASALNAGNPIVESGSLSGNSFVGVAPNYDPEYVSVGVKEEVRKRVGQRIRELESAVRRLEEMASHE
ncbi:hypothetical protein UA08_05461 [Talaromyces atroroseus]|uniref:Uncharacterized protein n=1 Tax=Talaromyces atroroseus TaxID=1441469 RepID=A0A225AEM7_TALAT|nr:hypothetical protein UA08_05461 [Talaromyces atroroseus]OKL59000.1 hypothetical protein UA08_05461 [Talaromyces atroroseus]